MVNLKVGSSISNLNSLVLSIDSGLSIKGNVTKEDVAIPCRVRLFEKLTGILLFDILTDENGFYSFNHLTKTKYFIVAHDPVSQYNAVIQDNVVPK